MGTAERREREAGERRKAILTAARKVFWEKGYARATMPQIAALAELAPGTLYLYFPSKDALYVELLVEGYEMLLPRLGAAAREGGDPATLGGRLIDVFIAFAREFPEYFDILFFILQREKDDWERFPAEQIEKLKSKELACKRVVIGVLDRAKFGTPESRSQTVDAVWSMLAGVVFHFRNHPEFDPIAAEARKLLVSAVFGRQGHEV